MRKVLAAGVVVLVMATGCNNPKKPSDGNFTRAIDKHLTVHGKACVNTAGEFPVDIPESEMSWKKQDVEKLNAFTRVGLLKSSQVSVPVRGMFGQETKPQPVMRYDLTDAGIKYLHQQPGFMGSVAGFCYGQEAVDSIVKWNEPATEGGFSVTVVTYRYRLNDVAGWAQDQNILTQHPEIKTEMDGAKVQERTIALQLTNKGWDAN